MISKKKALRRSRKESGRASGGKLKGIINGGEGRVVEGKRMIDERAIYRSKSTGRRKVIDSLGDLKEYRVS